MAAVATHPAPPLGTTVELPSLPPSLPSTCPSPDRASSPPLPVAIDHAHFPHILDNVFEHAPRRSLIALRAASRAFRDRADPLLVRHVKISSYAPADVSGRYGRVPALRPLDENDTESIDREQVVRQLAHTRVVDLVGPQGMPDDRLEWILSALSGVKTVRVRHRPAGPLPSQSPLHAAHLVTFTTFSESGLWDYPGVAEIGPVPDGTESLVLNIRYDPGRAWLPQGYITPGSTPPSLTNTTIVFTQITTHRESEAVWYRHAVKPMGLLNTIILRITMTLPRISYTLVDAQQLKLAWLGVQTGPGAKSPPDVVQKTIVKAVQDGLVRWSRWPEDEARAAAEEITFLTRDEYRAKVGDEVFALETAE